MQKVEGSNPFIRSMFPASAPEATWPSGLGTGLQNPLHRFDSGRRLLVVPRSPYLAVNSLLVSIRPGMGHTLP